MYDAKFENAVQRKMEELEFRPSESVWVNIEKAVAGKRRRRAIPFFWRLVVPAVLLTAAAGAYFFGEKSGKKTVAEPVAARSHSESGGVPKTGAGARGVDATRDGGIKGDVGRAGALKGGGRETDAVGTDASETVAARADVARADHRNRDVVKNAARMADGEKTDSRVAEEGADKLVETRDAAQRPRLAAWLFRPGLEDQRLAHHVRAAALSAERGMVRLSELSRPKRPWEAGFVAGGGVDRLNRLDASHANAAVSYSAASFYSLNQSAVSKKSISDVRPDASFYAGVYLQKAVSARWTFNTGVDLHYYSVRMSVGQQLNTYVPASATLLAPVAFAAAPQTVYTVGSQQTYTNRYYMLQLPVAMQYRINWNRMLPMFLEGGASVSRLMGSNALFYNPSSGLYLKSDNILNKTQIDLSSSLLVGLPFHGVRIQAGPQVQYGLTPLLNSQGLGDQHFLYTGIRLVVLPGRK